MFDHFRKFHQQFIIFYQCPYQNCSFSKPGRSYGFLMMGHLQNVHKLTIAKAVCQLKSFFATECKNTYYKEPMTQRYPVERKDTNALNKQISPRAIQPQIDSIVEDVCRPGLLLPLPLSNALSLVTTHRRDTLQKEQPSLIYRTPSLPPSHQPMSPSPTPSRL